MIPDRPPYTPTLLNRHGPDGVMYIRVAPYAVICALLVGAVTLKFAPRAEAWWMVPLFAAAGGAAGFWVPIGMARLLGLGYEHLMMSGASTPYREQYSREDALVMQGRVDEALASLETAIAADPRDVLARVKAAELYARERRDPARAAELFREVLRCDAAGTGEVVYATNRLVDLLTGPLGQPARALTELRRFIDSYPDAPAAQHAREALAALRARVHGPNDPGADDRRPS